MSLRADSRGMTLVELLIAIPLSLAIVVAAAAAVTLTAKTVKQCERLSQVNSAVREAYLAAADETDYWWSLDDPWDTNPARQPHRVTNSGTDDNGTGNPLVPIDLPPEFWNWDPSDPRTWQRTGCWRDNRDAIDYSVISSLGDLDPQRRWSHEVFDHVFNNMNIYGIAEYLPPTTYWWYLAKGTSGAYANSFGDPCQAAYSLRYGAVTRKLQNTAATSNHEDHSAAFGRQSGLHHCYMGVAPRTGWLAGTTWRGAEIGTVQQDTLAGSWPMNRQLDYLACPPEMKLRPASAPIVRGGLLRLETVSGRSPQLQLAVIDEQSGERVSYVFLIPGSTLRGARQQRDWPHWNPPTTRIDR